MTILHFTSTFLPNSGGTVTRIKNLIEDDGNQHVFHLLKKRISLKGANPTKDNKPNEYKNMKVITKDVNTSKKKISIKFINYFLAYYHLSKMRALEKIDVVEIHSSLGAIVGGIIYARDNDLPIIYNCHGLLSKKTDNFLMKNVISKLEKMVLKKSDVVIVQTDNEKEIIQNEYHLNLNNIFVIYNSVDTQFFKPIRNNSNETLKLLYSGYLNDINGVDMLLNWFSQYVENNNTFNLELNILGGGPLKKLVEDYEKKVDKIFYLGITTHERMPEHYNNCDIFIIPRPSLPSTESLLPMKLLEVMACGKIVLASNVEPIKKVVTDDYNGFLFKKENFNSFSEKLNYIINNINHFEQLKENARKTVQNYFSLYNSRKTMQSIYKQFE